MIRGTIQKSGRADIRARHAPDARDAGCSDPAFSPLNRSVIFLEPKFPAHVYVGQPKEENTMGKGLLLWLIGIPIPIILLIWLFGGLH